MGLFNRLRSKGHTFGTGVVLQGPPPADPRAWAPPPRTVGSSGRRGDPWLPSHSVRHIAGYTIAGGLVYVGSHLPGQRTGTADPALIDPALKVGRVPNRSGQGLTYWPGYKAISPESRAAYLEWLATGRNNPHVPIGYVFLYFYGLERRILVDCADPGPHRPELVLLRSEIKRLLSIYGGQRSFQAYAFGLLSILDRAVGFRSADPPQYQGEKWSVPAELRSALGEFSRDRQPIPAPWALAWAMFHPEIYPRTPVTRCPDEFARLFALRYSERYGAGMLVAAPKRTITITYQPANATLNPVHWNTGVPDIFELAAPGKRLATLVQECTDELDAYSRWLGRYPGSQGTLQAVALLPAALVSAAGEPVSGLVRFVEGCLAGADQARIDGGSLVQLWSGDDRPALTRQESTALVQLLASQGVGVEPDPRFGGGPLGAGPAVLFRTERTPGPNMASSEYSAAVTVLRLAAAVAVADTTSEAEQEFLSGQLGTALRLAPAESRRLRAHLSLLLAAPVKLTGLASRLAALPTAEREGIAALCVAVAAADGVVAPSEVTALRKIYKLLGIPDARVFQDVHATTATASRTETPPADEPVTVRPPTERVSGRYEIPAPPQPRREPRGFVLDRNAIAVKIAETAKVGELLGSIFADEEEPVTRHQPAPVPDVVRIAGLDAPHSRLLTELAGVPEWSRAAVEDLCLGLGLLTDGALETLNDAAYECCGDPVVKGDDPLTVDLDVVREMER